LAEDKGSPSLLELARTKQATKRAVRCTIGKVLRDRPELAPQIQELISAAADPDDTLTYATAGAIIGETVGYRVDGQTLGRHMRGGCSCDVA
jgi:hypothetical protein